MNLEEFEDKLREYYANEYDISAWLRRANIASPYNGLTPYKFFEKWPIFMEPFVKNITNK